MLASIFFFCSIFFGLLFLVGMKPAVDDSFAMKTNYAGRSIPTSIGLIFVPVYLLVWAIAKLVQRTMNTQVSQAQNILLVLILGMCFLGLLDDLLGDGRSRGFKGHIAALIGGRVTTGFIKALGGFLVAMAAASPISTHIWEWFLNSAIIALCANLFNLLDTRPGRAMKVFFPLFALTVALTWRFGSFYIPPALSVAAVAIVLLPGDLNEQYMLGDAGSNVLGAIVGIGLVIGLGRWWRIGVLVAFALLSLLSEKYSFSRVIEANRVLKWLDMLGRKGENAKGANYK